MQLNMGLTVNADDTVDGQLLLTAQKSLLSQRNKNIQAAFAELRQDVPALPQGEETGYADDKLFGTQISYHKAPLAGFDTESVKLVGTAICTVSHCRSTRRNTAERLRSRIRNSSRHSSR